MDSIEESVIYSQKMWANALIKIGHYFLNKKDYISLAKENIKRLYAFDISTVLFKPTKASDTQFRTTLDETISYFVGSNNICPEDKGFALEPWKKVRFENFRIVKNSNITFAMGNYFFSNFNNKEIKVEYTFGYITDKRDNLRINLHHSSIPFVK